jgi:hypothetical protein
MSRGLIVTSEHVEVGNVSQFGAVESWDCPCRELGKSRYVS